MTTSTRSVTGISARPEAMIVLAISAAGLNGRGPPTRGAVWGMVSVIAETLSRTGVAASGQKSHILSICGPPLLLRTSSYALSLRCLSACEGGYDEQGAIYWPYRAFLSVLSAFGLLECLRTLRAGTMSKVRVRLAAPSLAHTPIVIPDIAYALPRSRYLSACIRDPLGSPQSSLLHSQNLLVMAGLVPAIHEGVSATEVLLSFPPRPQHPPSSPRTRAEAGQRPVAQKKDVRVHEAYPLRRHLPRDLRGNEALQVAWQQGASP